ncbi:MAG TPA: response regulator [Patescibacteria group bacterium]
MKVLLVDDEEAILEVFKQALIQDPSFEVLTALTGNQGLELTKKEHPDVIFLDQVLPDMNGNDVLQQLKSDPDTKNIPIAILSNFNQDTLVENAMKIGASDYVLKYQIAPRDLLEKAKQLVKESGIVATPPQTAAAVTPPAQSVQPQPDPTQSAQVQTQPMPTSTPIQPQDASTQVAPTAPLSPTPQPNQQPITEPEAKS